ncbi:MAG: hypothetical protein MJE66_05635, partial [Proteobacteria bacterium]|nr:hypothetical protein [Pseudomonadota bacterium]
MKWIRSVRLLINFQTLVVTLLSVASTAACLHWNVVADFPLTLIATAIVFPIVFSIGGAYKRREAALDDYGAMKAHGRAIYFAARDWIAEPDPLLLKQVREGLLELFQACREFFQQPIEETEAAERRVYASFSRLSLVIRSFRDAGLASGEVSRCNQYLSKTIGAFETVKHIYQYRTPRT